MQKVPPIKEYWSSRLLDQYSYFETSSTHPNWLNTSCVHLCVCGRQRDRERGRQKGGRGKLRKGLFMGIIMWLLISTLDFVYIGENSLKIHTCTATHRFAFASADGGCCIEMGLFSHGVFKPFHSCTHTDKDLPMLPHYHNNTASLSTARCKSVTHSLTDTHTQRDALHRYSQEALLSFLNRGGEAKGHSTFHSTQLKNLQQQTHTASQM